MTWKVLVSTPYMQQGFDEFRPRFASADIEPVLPVVTERLSEAELLPLVGDIDGAICGDDAFTDMVLKRAPRLKVIAKWGTGIDSIDGAACVRRGIAVRNTPDAFTDPVADSVLAYILCFARQTLTMNQAMHEGRWCKIPGRALNECTLGVIGVGRIGSAVVRRARAFGVRVLGHDVREISSALVAETGLVVVDRDTLLREADFVTLNCDLNPRSRHLIGPRELSLMRHSAVLINTARGPIVNEVALVAALQSGHLGGAALDVFEHEPLPEDSALRQMPNVLMAPHNSNSSPRAWARAHESTFRNLLEELTRE